MPRVVIAEIRTVSEEILKTMGVPQTDAELIADTIVYAHRHEKHTHGITRLPIYVKKIKESLMPPVTSITVLKDIGAMCCLDAGNGFGQVSCAKAMELCTVKAEQYGVGVVTVANSNNFGVTAYFGEMATKKNMVGIVASASGPAIAPAGGGKPLFGTNPICIAFPTKDGAPIILDMAVANAARGKIRLAEKNGEKIPFGWALDKDGNPTDDPIEALKGSMLPIGGHKGAGLALMVDLLAGLLSGSVFGGDIKPLNHPTKFSRHGHLVIALDISKFMTLHVYQEKIQAFISKVKACSKDGDVLLPGENSWLKSVNNRDITTLNQKQIDNLNALAEEHGIKQRVNIW